LLCRAIIDRETGRLSCCLAEWACPTTKRGCHIVVPSNLVSILSVARSCGLGAKPMLVGAGCVRVLRLRTGHSSLKTIYSLPANLSRMRTCTSMICLPSPLPLSMSHTASTNCPLENHSQGVSIHSMDRGDVHGACDRPACVLQVQASGASATAAEVEGAGWTWDDAA
jgi:hypothetical protein